ncbi:SH3 domain-containing protein [Exilibacterium tricleocarpae]|nr:SH3 domain-containing protein [Exilibacterium tricleocarpae]
MDKGRVKSDTGLNLRDKPNGHVIGVLRHNEEVELLDEVSFFRVRNRAGEIGYVHGDYLEQLPAGTGTSAAGTWSPHFEPVTYANARFVGEKIRVDRDFTPELDKIAGFAEQTDLQIWVTSSIRQLNNQVNGAIVKPAAKSCHHIGHAIDMNLLYRNELYNSKKLRKSHHPKLPGPLLDFIQLLRKDATLRWGGDFTTEDPVHIDDNLYNRDTVLYQAKLDNRVNRLNA